MTTFVVNSRRLGRIIFRLTEENNVLIKYPDQEKPILCCLMGTHSREPIVSSKERLMIDCRNWLNQRNKHFRLREYTIKWSSPEIYELP